MFKFEGGKKKRARFPLEMFCIDFRWSTAEDLLGMFFRFVHMSVVSSVDLYNARFEILVIHIPWR